MSTFMANKGNIERKWYILDAAGKPLGQDRCRWQPPCCGASISPSTPPTPTAATSSLSSTPRRPCSPARSWIRSTTARHSGYVGGLKETKYRKLMQDKPELAMKLAVRGMMPRNIITKDSLTRLKIFRGRRAHPRRTEARTVGRRIRRSETHV